MHQKTTPIPISEEAKEFCAYVDAQPMKTSDRMRSFAEIKRLVALVEEVGREPVFVEQYRNMPRSQAIENHAAIALHAWRSRIAVASGLPAPIDPLAAVTQRLKDRQSDRLRRWIEFKRNHGIEGGAA